MSRNLAQTGCAFCGGLVKTTEPPRKITEQDCHVYFKEYNGLIVADAMCVDCEAPYLAWLDDSHMARGGCFSVELDANGNLLPRDLSHKHAFNDEPAAEDYPKYVIEVRRIRTQEWPKCETCGAPKYKHWRDEKWICHDHYKHPK